MHEIIWPRGIFYFFKSYSKLVPWPALDPRSTDSQLAAISIMPAHITTHQVVSSGP